MAPVLQIRQHLVRARPVVRFFLDYHRFGLLVFSKTKVAGMAQHPLIGELKVGSLGNQLRFDPVGTTHSRPRSLKCRLLARERCHDFQKALYLIAGKSRADLAGVARLSILVYAQKKRAEPPLLVKRRPAYKSRTPPDGCTGPCPNYRSASRYIATRFDMTPSSPALQKLVNSFSPLPTI